MERKFMRLMSKMFDTETKTDELTRTLVDMNDAELRYVVAEMATEYGGHAPFFEMYPVYFSSITRIITYSMRKDECMVRWLIADMRKM